ncbi:SprT-like domain-containing protein [Serratia sp. Se-RSBMAAmG]|uniref:SprT-like domain-containing protein n=1 Tax=Serratia sp. Se-RSBMAAmG TaxID=3043305 RepID=UPI0024AFAC1F|nr:SprT-like domain-containing protein [Serratia sp. Se-RSBMAAmG]MDI6977158.1 SprT-like domain-containing protein [Serratia sp. Se-RSBMAAmG]
MIKSSLLNKTTLSGAPSEEVLRDIIVRLEKRVKEVITQADALDLPGKISHSGVSLSFRQGSRAVALARFKRDVGAVMGYKLGLEFDIHAISEDVEYVLDKVVPHEVAHLVCFVNFNVKGRKIKPHGREFQAICTMLGGELSASTKRIKTMVSARKPRAIYRFKYLSIDGEEVLLTKAQHEMLQKKRCISFTNNKTKKTRVVASRDFYGKVQVR